MAARVVGQARTLDPARVVVQATEKVEDKAEARVARSEILNQDVQEA